MTAPFRITRPATAIKQANSPAARTAEEVKWYADRLVKLIPVEVISLYLIGKGVIGSDAATQTPLSYWIGWTAFCFVAVIITRVLGTSDPQDNKTAQIPAVLVACVSYWVWIYSMGDVFALLKLHEPKLATLIMFGWTFVVPYFYKGDSNSK